MFGSLIHILQQQPLLRVHQFSFSGRNVEEGGIKPVDVLQIPSLTIRIAPRADLIGRQVVVGILSS
ncbi:hypothetical protein D3C75_794110 [compost metagenome]